MSWTTCTSIYHDNPCIYWLTLYHTKCKYIILLYNTPSDLFIHCLMYICVHILQIQLGNCSDTSFSHACLSNILYEITDTVEAHSWVDIVVKFTDEHYTTINQATAERFDPRVFVNCLPAEKCCERRLFIWLQSGDVINVCVNKVNTMIGCGTQAEVTLVRVWLVKIIIKA